MRKPLFPAVRLAVVALLLSTLEVCSTQQQQKQQQQPTLGAAAKGKGRGSNGGRGSPHGKSNGKGRGRGGPHPPVQPPPRPLASSSTGKRPATLMARSAALAKLNRSELGWAAGSKAMKEAQKRLASTQAWLDAQRSYLESVKRALIGNATTSPKKLNEFDASAVCKWDCYQRMTMLEPLIDYVLKTNVPGDVVEAGVFTGGVSIYLAAMLCSRGALGDAPGQRKLWMADSFKGMPPETASKGAGYSAEGFTAGTLVGTEDTVRRNFAHIAARVDLDVSATGLPPASCRMPSTWPRLTMLPSGAHTLPGWFNESLPGPITQVALLRADSDLYVSIKDTLTRLYPLLSVGGFVVFDDFKFTQAQEAILGYRKAHGITSLLQRSDALQPPPFRSLDKMVYWQKDAVTG
jgi:hypothetical protein